MMESIGPASPNPQVADCPKGTRRRIPSAFERGERSVEVGGAFLGDPRLNGDEKLLLIAVEAFSPDFAPEDEDLAVCCGWFLPDGRPNVRHAQRVYERVVNLGRLAKRPGGRNGGRAGFTPIGTRPGDGPTTMRPVLRPPQFITSSVTETATVDQSSTSPMTPVESDGADDFEPAPEPCTLTAQDLATFERLAGESRLSRSVEDRYRAARFALGRIYPAGPPDDVTVPAVADVLGKVWRHGLDRLARRERAVADALAAAGIAMRKVPGFAR